MQIHEMFIFTIQIFVFTQVVKNENAGIDSGRTKWCLSFLYVCMVNTIYLLSFVETPRKFIIAELSIRKLGSSSVLIIHSTIIIALMEMILLALMMMMMMVLLALMKIRAYGSKALQ